MWNEIGQASLCRATERPIHAKPGLKHTERGAQHCNNGRPTPVCDPHRPNRNYSLTRHPWRVQASISMQNVNWSTRRPPFFHHFSNYSTPTYVVVVLFVVNQRSKLHTYGAEVPIWHTPVEVAEVRFGMTCSVVDGQGKRGNAHTPAIMSVDFPDVAFDGFI